MLRAKWHEASEFIPKHDVVCFTESKLDDKATSGSFDITGYHLVRQDRNSNGGGVVIFINEDWNPIDLGDIQDKFVKRGLEVTVTSVSGSTPAFKAIILGIYCPPNTKVAWFEAFNDLLLDVIPLGLLVILGNLSASS